MLEMQTWATLSYKDWSLPWGPGLLGAQIRLGIGLFFELPEEAVDLGFSSSEADPIWMKSKGCVGSFFLHSDFRCGLLQKDLTPAVQFVLGL